MARQIGKLAALTVKRTKKPGYYGDGGGLWLQVSRSGTKSWIFRYTRDGRTRDMGLGSLTAVSLADARPIAQGCRKLLSDGLDPIEHRRSIKAAARLDAAKAISFDDCAEKYIEAHKLGWRSTKHAKQWRATLETHVSPVLGLIPVQDVDTALVIKVLEPIWATKTETASRVRGRIEAVLDWAAAREYRSGENPARWRGHLKNLLPKRSKVRRVKHHLALPYPEVGSFVRELRQQNTIAAESLEFLILTATRTGETIGAQWIEFDLKKCVWTVPPERVKAEKVHRVPLAKPVLAILQRMAEARQSDYVFPGQRYRRPLSNMALLSILRRMGRPGITVHGFRSTFRDWAAEQTNYPREVAEMALAHAVSDEVEAAYRRGDLLEKRKRLMNEWARYCEVDRSADHDDKVTPLRPKAKTG